MDKNPNPNSFKIADVHAENGRVVLQLEDGRMFGAAVKEGVDVKRGATVSLEKVELDKDGVPTDATVTKVLA